MPLTKASSEFENLASPAEVIPPSSPFSDWLVRRRVTISLIGFGVLAAINLGVLKTKPLDPLDWTNLPTVGACLLILGGLGIRSWAAGTLHKSASVTRDGPYALVRNPLYVGSFLMMFGFCGLLRDIPSALFVAGPMVAVYWVTTLREEKNLAQWFADDWPPYQRLVPRFIPKLYSSRMFGGWSFQQWRKNREYQAVLATLFGAIAVHFL